MKQSRNFVVCIANKGYPASLERRKIYERLPDPQAERDHLARIIDESGEDYLYPAAFFLPIKLSPALEHAVEAAAELQTA